MPSPKPRIAVSLACAALFAATPPSAQDEAPSYQFVELEGAVEGPTYWTEGHAFADVEQDGDWDVFAARGEGLGSPGEKHQNGLYVNKLEEGGVRFVDEGRERLGPSQSHARDVAVADVDSDGWIDAVFANGFNTAPPYLFINRGKERPGHFRNESDLRGFSEALSSGTATFADADDDGDLDLFLADSGPRHISAPGGRPRLYLNDGAGYFVEAPDRIAAPLKVGNKGIHMADIDNDWDLDLVGPCRVTRAGTGHYLMLGNGDGYLNDASWMFPTTTDITYEGEVADLDGDLDLDIFLLAMDELEDSGSRFPFCEGPLINQLAETGELAFVKGPCLGGGDDNDVVLLDHDMDGDLDAFIASLGDKEKLIRNDGGMQWAIDETVIQPIDDSTLDMGGADLDNDGDIDLFTLQAIERIGVEQPPCRVYLNQGPPDTRPPTLLAQEELGRRATPAGPWVVHARVQDELAQDGQSFLSAEVHSILLDEQPEVRIELDGTAQRSAHVLQPGSRLVFENLSDAPLELTLAGSAVHIDPGGEHASVWVRAGVYTWSAGKNSGEFGVCTPDEGCAELLRGRSLHAGSGWFRFELAPAPDARAGQRLAWQIAISDRAGNQRIAPGLSAELSTPRRSGRGRR